MVKPARGGSSLGVRRVDDRVGLPAALLSALAYDDHVLCERFVEGREVTVTVLRGEALPPVEAIPLGATATTSRPATRRARPSSRCRRRSVRSAAQVAAAACLALSAAARFARVDLLVPDGAPPWILEVNIVPGLTETSTAPLAAQAAGMTFEELVAALLEDAVAAG